MSSPPEESRRDLQELARLRRENAGLRAKLDGERSAAVFAYPSAGQAADAPRIFLRLGDGGQARPAGVEEAAPEGICAMDSDFVITMVNQRLIEMTGYGREELLGRAVDIFMFPENLAEHTQRISRRSQGSPEQYEIRLRRKDGSELWAMVAAIPLWDAAGVFAGSYAMLTDITERKRAEQAVLASEAKFATVFDHAPLLLTISRLEDGVYLDVNRRFLEVSGLEREEVIGRTSVELGWISAAERERLAAEIKAQGRVKGMELVLAAKDGRAVTCLYYGEIIDVKGQPRLLSIAQDISERVVMEKALRASEERFRQLYDDAPIAYQSLDPDGLLIQVNQAWLAALGYTREEVVGRWFGFFLHPDLIAHFEKNFPCFKEAGQIRGVEFRMRRKDGSTLLAAFDGVIAYDEAGRMLRSHCVFADISERRRLEEQLRQSQKMEALGTLAGGIAHDFNNILGAVLGFAELAQEAVAEGENPREELAEIIAAAERARNLVRRILTFSRKVEADLRPLRLNQVLTQVLPMLERALPRMVGIELALEPKLGLVNADPGQVSQILLNLAGNAADAMPESGRLLIETANLLLGEAERRDYPEAEPGPYVLLRVSDTGAGMDAQTLERIFEPFFTTKEVSKGTGLGLSTVHGIVKAHRGHLRCESSPGQGTRFTILLPALAEGADDAGEAAPSSSAAAAPRPPARGTLLAVDDEQTLLAVAGRALAAEGYDMLTAASGESALEILAGRPGRVDLVLLDLGMPGMGGLKCLQRILAEHPGVPVVIASGYASDDQVRKALEGGAAGFVAKPYRRADLIAAVRRTLDKAGVRAAG
jgi:PAS domain S-box-containing protein